MNIKKKILIFFTLSLVHFCILQLVSGEDETKSSKTIELNGEVEDEIKKMSKGLEEERKELAKLKIEFQKLSQSNKQIDKDEVALENSEENNAEDKEITANEQHNLQLSVKKNTSVNENVLGNVVNKDEKEKILLKKNDELINPIEIAENLYKLGEYKLALDIYELTNKEDLENEKKSWILYQMANCSRKLKLFDKALKVYRNIQDQYEDTFWAEQAKWYINDIQWRAEVQDKLEMVVEK